jgi:signal transduction histidine kinase/ActR/RegA family two-component response regulator
MKIGFLGGSINAEVIKEFYPDLNFFFFLVDGFDNAAEMLRTGEIDIFAGEGVADPLFDKYGFINSKEFFPLIYTSVSMTTANPELQAIISVVNKYITAGGVDKLYEFYNQGDEEYSRYKLYNSFIEEERAYINDLMANNKTVKIALEHDNYPYSFYNKTDKEFQGIAVDVLNEVSRLTDIVFEPVHTEISPWAEIFGMLQKGEVSLVSQLIQTEERTGNFLWPDSPYASTPYVLISKLDYPHLAIYQLVRTKVGVISESAYEEMYRLWFPENDNLIGYNTYDDALDALEAGEIDLLMGTENLLLMQQNYREKPGYKVNIRFGTPTESYFGLNINEKLLCSIISKAQTFVKTRDIVDKWDTLGFDYTRKMAQQRALFFMSIAIVAVFVLILSGFTIRKNRKLNRNLDGLVKDRTQKLEKQTHELVRQKHELEEQKQAAQAAAKAKGTFLATMSHEIRTPLNAIIGMANIAQKAEDLEKSRGSIKQILTSSYHLLGILNDVLDISKIESGKLGLIMEPCWLLDAYNELNGIIEQRCFEKGIKYTTNINDLKNMILIGDRLRVNQVLINLLGNAVKFTSKDGEIKISIAITNETEKNVTLLFSVSDTGIGMSDEQLKKLFVPFEQADREVTVKYGGSGLGLAISQNLIGMMGGVIKVESELGAGSRFYFELTLDKGEEIIQIEAPLKSLDLTGRRILLVEDIEINRLIIIETLAETNVDIDEAENGQIAVEMFSASILDYYDMVFMDIQMPIMGGYEATEKIRALDRQDAKSIPIIAITANTYKEDIDAAISSGMNEHISKPIDAENVMDCLRKYLN